MSLKDREHKMTRAEYLRQEAREKIAEAKTRTFIQWKVSCDWHINGIESGYVDEATLENYIKPQYEELRQGIAVIRTTAKTMAEIREFESIEILEHKGTYYKVKFNY